MHYAIIQTGPGVFELLKLNKSGDSIRSYGKIVSNKRGGADYTAYDHDRKVGVNGSGTHRECRDKLLEFWELNSMHVEGHTFRKKAEKKAGRRVA